MAGQVVKLPVGREHRQVVTEAKLRQQGVDRPDLNAGSPASVSQFRGVDVVPPVRNQQRQCGKPVDYLLPVPRSGKTMQQFLEDQTGHENCLAGFDGTNQCAHFCHWGRRVAAQR